MIATFLIEAALLVYTLVRHATPISRLIMATLACLATFQLAEYGICVEFGLSNELWARIGFIAITLLPPLGIHLISMISRRVSPMLVTFGYLAASVFIVGFAFRSGIFENIDCHGNYMIFNLHDNISPFYGLYYYGLLLFGIYLSATHARLTKKKPIRQALHLQAIGYMSFLLPTAIVNTMSTDSLGGTPSIMCGFAVLYAFILVFGILPRVSTER